MDRAAYDRPVTTPGATSAYRYVAGEPPLDAGDRAAAWLRQPRGLAALTVTGLILGMVLAMVVMAAWIPDYLRTVLLAGLISGGALALWLVVVAVAMPPLARRLKRRLFARRFPTGSVIDIELTEDALVIRRASATRELPYRQIQRMRTIGAYLQVVTRGRIVAAVLPAGVLPDDALETIRIRSRAPLSLSVPSAPRRPDREVVVPVRWAAHVAAVVTGAGVRTRRPWVKWGGALAVSVPLAVLGGRGWLLLAPAMVLLNVLTTYLVTRLAVARALPANSVASTEFGADRFVSRNTGGVREVRFDDVSAVTVRAGVVLLRLSSERRLLSIAADLIPEHQLRRLQESVRS